MAEVDFDKFIIKVKIMPKFTFFTIFNGFAAILEIVRLENPLNFEEDSFARF
jgi:hypothetical protein